MGSHLPGPIGTQKAREIVTYFLSCACEECYPTTARGLLLFQPCGVLVSPIGSLCTLVYWWRKQGSEKDHCDGLGWLCGTAQHPWRGWFHGATPVVVAKEEFHIRRALLLLVLCEIFELTNWIQSFLWIHDWVMIQSFSYWRQLITLVKNLLCRF